jgi:rsbT co-antagonist protein RsbR
MIEQQNAAPLGYEQAQHALFSQILQAVRIGVIAVLVISLGALAIPTLRTAPIAILACVVVVELGVTELSHWLVRRGRTRQGAIVYLMMTLILATMVGAVLHLPAFVVAITALLVAMGALLIGPRYALAPGITGIVCYTALTVAGQQDWLQSIEVPQTSWLVTGVQVGFVVTALSVVIVLSVLLSTQLRHSVTEAQLRAEEAERMRNAQIALTDQLEIRVAEQRHLLEIIQELEVPIVPVLSGVLVLPLIGHLDSQRLQAIEQQVLQQVAAARAELLLVDVTGVLIFDTTIAKAITRLGQALRLLGTRMALTGLKPAMAQTLVQVEANLSGIKTYARIQDALSVYEQQLAIASQTSSGGQAQ